MFEAMNHVSSSKIKCQQVQIGGMSRQQPRGSRSGRQMWGAAGCNGRGTFDQGRAARGSAGGVGRLIEVVDWRSRSGRWEEQEWVWPFIGWSGSTTGGAVGRYDDGHVSTWPFIGHVNAAIKGAGSRSH